MRKYPSRRNNLGREHESGAQPGREVWSFLERCMSRYSGR